MPRGAPPLAERLWSRVQVQPNGCWEWTGAKVRGGYGGISLNHRLLKAHRVAWSLSYGPIPVGKLVLHRCDNPPCIRPTHLFLGTQQDNMVDMLTKGRGNIGTKHWTHKNPEKVKRGADHWSKRLPGRMPRGEAVRGSKLTEDQVREIRRLRAEGVLIKDLAAQFNMSISSIGFIVTGQTWRHLL